MTKAGVSDLSLARFGTWRRCEGSHCSIDAICSHEVRVPGRVALDVPLQSSQTDASKIALKGMGALRHPDSPAQQHHSFGFLFLPKRFMNYNGCKRKFKIADFVARYPDAAKNAAKVSGRGK